MLEKKSVFLIAVYTYLLSIFVAFITSHFFSFFYDKVLNPPKVGYGLFYGRGEELIIGGIIFSYIFFLPLFTMILASRKIWLIWFAGVIIPVAIFFSEGNYLLWFVIFTIAGGLIGWLIKLAIKEFQKT